MRTRFNDARELYGQLMPILFLHVFVLSVHVTAWRLVEPFR
jgi:hypothetical protein